MRPLVTLLLLASGPGLAATLTRGPYLQLAEATGITVVFRTDVPSVGSVRFGSFPGPLDRSAAELVPRSSTPCA